MHILVFTCVVSISLLSVLTLCCILTLQADLFRTSICPTLSLYGIEDGVEFKIKKRGAPPKGGYVHS